MPVATGPVLCPAVKISTVSPSTTPTHLASWQVAGFGLIQSTDHSWHRQAVFAFALAVERNPTIEPQIAMNGR